MVVAGIDELSTDGIVEIGLVMIKRASFPVPSDLSMLLARWPSKFTERCFSYLQNHSKTWVFYLVSPRCYLSSRGSLQKPLTLDCFRRKVTLICKFFFVGNTIPLFARVPSIYSQMRGCLWIIRMGMLWRK